jgi:hypothetical protein
MHIIAVRAAVFVPPDAWRGVVLYNADAGVLERHGGVQLSFHWSHIVEDAVAPGKGPGGPARFLIGASDVEEPV